MVIIKPRNMGCLRWLLVCLKDISIFPGEKSDKNEGFKLFPAQGSNRNTSEKEGSNGNIEEKQRSNWKKRRESS